MQSLRELWHGQGRRSRIGLAAGVVLIAALAGSAAYWAYHPAYQVLFSGLDARDAAAMTAELDKMKVEYQLADNGASILVPQEVVYRTRLKLAGGEIPLQGAVGFEVFNNADFGMTEFVQRVNYLRAVQGELTRTIQAVDGIKAARVHLALPEQGLFKKAATKPKASVTLTLKNGHVLSAHQVNGIQRLVAASVPDVSMQDVTVLDQHGVALTRPVGEEGAELSGAQLESKRSAEDYLQRKIAVVLDQAFGAGEAIASVDVLLATEHGKVTTEEVLPARGATAPSGVIVRQRQNAQDSEPAAGATPMRTGQAGANSSETEYQVGRRVEQRTVPSGALKRMTIAVVVKQRLDFAQVDRLRQVVAMAVGLDEARGDAIVVNSIDQLANPVIAAPAPDAVAGGLAAGGDDEAPAQAAPRPDRWSGNAERIVLVLAALMVLLVPLALLLARRRADVVAPQPALLDDAARARVLADVRRWIGTPASDVSGPAT